MASQNGEKEESDHVLRHSFDVVFASRLFRVRRTGLVCIFAFGENYGVAAVETGGKQQSTGLLH